MASINTEGLSAARLNDDQLTRLKEAERELNRIGQSQEIYLLAVTRQPS